MGLLIGGRVGISRCVSLPRCNINSLKISVRASSRRTLSDRFLRSLTKQQNWTAPHETRNLFVFLISWDMRKRWEWSRRTLSDRFLRSLTKQQNWTAPHEHEIFSSSSSLGTWGRGESGRVAHFLTASFGLSLSSKIERLPMNTKSFRLPHLLGHEEEVRVVASHTFWPLPSVSH